MKGAKMQNEMLCRLVRESRYTIPDDEIAQAILARITMPAVTPMLKRPPRRRSVRSFHPARHISSFRLIREGMPTPAMGPA